LAWSWAIAMGISIEVSVDEVLSQKTERIASESPTIERTHSFDLETNLSKFERKNCLTLEAKLIEGI
jgi:hypothetical protein